MSSFLFYTGTCGFVLGITLRSFFDIDLPTIIWVVLISFILALIWRRGSKNTQLVLTASIFLFLCALGLLRMEVASWSEGSTFFESNLDTTVKLEGVVMREPDVRENVIQISVKTNNEILLVMVPADTQIFYGDQVTIEGLLQKPVSFETDLGRTFNYEGYLRARGIEYIVTFASVEVTAHDQTNFLIGELLRFKHRFMENIESVIHQPQAGLGEGLLLGVKRALGEDLETAFRKTGIMHIVVLSGYNIMLVIVFVMYVLSFVLPVKIRFWFGLISIILFAAMVGFSATVVRASIMAGLVLIAKQLGRTYTVMRALLLTGVGMILLNPYLLAFDVGFQLSFIATLGLILVAPLLERFVTFMPKVFGLRDFLTATVATQILVTPILLYQIGEFSVVSVVVNMLVLPMVPVAMFLTFITGMIGLISIDIALLPGYLAHLSLSYILFIAQFFARLPLASFVVPAFPFSIVVGIYLVMSWGIWKLYHTENNTYGSWTIIDESSIVKNDTSKTSISVL